ncbi:acetyltransferase [Isoptericola sp. NPDC056618]|uniref:acetyltransferase n=1 Tax=Isoptericola sp. NPDC056618 TaxID=3345878 RepID=UPI0036B643F6
MTTPHLDPDRVPESLDLSVRPGAGPEEYPRLVEIWRSAVDATHAFLAEDDRARIEERLASAYLPHVRVLVAERAGRAVGFAGVSDGALEMLFVDAADRGTGVGRALLAHVVDRCGVTTVDVNEQNAQALGFYERAGFTVTGRSPVDDEGRPYPLLHLTLSR